MSVIIENLKEAINGESNAKRRYELFAEKAKEENLPEIAQFFEAISTAEAIHVRNHMRALQILTDNDVKVEDFIEVNEKHLKNKVKDTKSNLIDAITGETYETKQMYKDFIKNSKKEGNEVAELTFSLARKAEKVHANVFRKSLRQLEKEIVIDSRKIYVCQICGNVEFNTPPLVCQLCDHTQKFFKEV